MATATCPLPRAAPRGRRKYGEYLALGSRIGSDVHGQLRGSVRSPSFSRVTAESVYEAAALGVSGPQEEGWADAMVLGSELEIQVREPPTVAV